MSNISSWSTSSAANNSASPDGWPEGMLPGGVNDSGREVMGAVKRWYVDAEWRFFEYAFVRQSANSFLVSITATDVFSAGRRLRLIDGGVTIFGDVIASSMSGANTLVTVSSSALSSSLSSGSVANINPAQTSLPFMNALTSTASVTASDYLEVWQSGTGVRRRALQTDVVRGASAVLVAETAFAGATSYTIASSLPSWVKKIEIMFEAASTNGTSIPMIQIGDAGGVETSGYVSGGLTMDVINDSSSAGFLLAGNNAANRAFYGTATLTLKDSTNNTWAFSSNLYDSANVRFQLGAGVKSLSAVLDRVVITTVNGTDTLDAGDVAVSYYG